MITKDVQITHVVRVTVDETKFTKEFLAEFQSYMFQFRDVNKHIEHLGYLFAVNLLDEYSSFVEGYGRPSDFGMKFEHVVHDVEIL
jgi:hypothetical protein